MKFVTTALTAVAAVTSFVFVTAAQAQDMTVRPSNPNFGLTIFGTSSMSAISKGENFGGDGKGTVSTFVDGGMKLGVDTKLSASTDPECKIGCDLKITTLTGIGEMIAGGRTTNQGSGYGPVSSVMGLNNAMAATLTVTFTQNPTIAGPLTTKP